MPRRKRYIERRANCRRPFGSRMPARVFPLADSFRRSNNRNVERTIGPWAKSPYQNAILVAERKLLRNALKQAVFREFAPMFFRLMPPTRFPTSPQHADQPLHGSFRHRTTTRRWKRELSSRSAHVPRKKPYSTKLTVGSGQPDNTHGLKAPTC